MRPKIVTDRTEVEDFSVIGGEVVGLFATAFRLR
jgi:hypothetical protein